MKNRSKKLPQLGNAMFITDGGMETDLLFNYGIDLPEFASYDLLRSAEGEQTLYDYFRIYIDIARRHKLGLVLETPTWRANSDWGKRIGDSPESLAGFNKAAVALIERVRDELAGDDVTVVISGCIGPRGDGYAPDSYLSVEESRQYHQKQIAQFAETSADLVSALTICHPAEAAGISLAARQHNIPVCISFTVETDGRLPSGDSLSDAIEQVDEYTDSYPAYYMINCAHPTHFEHLFENADSPLWRVKGIRGNASCLSHAELDNATELDDGDPVAFGLEISGLRRHSHHLNVLGGCCGTDHRHIEQLSRHLSGVVARNGLRV